MNFAQQIKRLKYDGRKPAKKKTRGGYAVILYP